MTSGPELDALELAARDLVQFYMEDEWTPAEHIAAACQFAGTRLCERFYPHRPTQEECIELVVKAAKKERPAWDALAILAYDWLGEELRKKELRKNKLPKRKQLRKKELR